MSKGPPNSLTALFILECNFIIWCNCQSPQNYSRYFKQRVIQYIHGIYTIVGRAKRMHSKLSLQKLLPEQHKTYLPGKLWSHHSKYKAWEHTAGQWSRAQEAGIRNPLKLLLPFPQLPLGPRKLRKGHWNAFSKEYIVF